MAYDNAKKEGIKPAMEVIHGAAVPDLQTAHTGPGLPGAPPRGPRLPDPMRLGGVLTLRLSGDLRSGLSAAAKGQGITESAVVRRLIADHIGAAAEADRASGRRQRVPDAELQVLAGIVREIGALYGPARAGQPDELVAGLDRIRAALVPIVTGMGRQA